MRLLGLIARRLIWVPLTLLGLVVLVFMVSHVVPSDPARILAGENATTAQLVALRHEYGFDRPLPVQLLRYIVAVIHGNMGISLYTETPVAGEIWRRLPATMELAFYSMLVAVGLGVPLGVAAALNRNSWFDHVLRVVTVSGLAIAAFWLAILLQLLFSMWLGVTPVQGRISDFGPSGVTGFYTIDAALSGDWSMEIDVLRHLALPVATLSFPAMATIVRFTRAGVIGTLGSFFVDYQRAMGIPRRVTVWRYVLRSALTGTLTQIGLVFGNLLAGAVVVEAVFDWPGLGQFAVNSILQSDYNAILGFTIYVGVMFVAVNLLIDIGQVVLDPRGR
ncbi:MAG TPA: ABC transporter permease [Acetobacteraceae bacterium]|nr:ABC transporter permease [Acetobacteraceae bacterium]